MLPTSALKFVALVVSLVAAVPVEVRSCFSNTSICFDNITNTKKDS